ncbi:MAG: alpha-glucoside-specific PTS transporter subunit IIBC [Elusimicrobiota bacterium]|jgi:PTS system arbutin-like IIC component|nr:alpha-glucoside-specific PTS transporter subunit IIBC [Elusimicrobiota bacterium]
MLEKIQKFGGALFTPVLLFPFAGIAIALGILFTTEMVMGSIAKPGTLWYQIWNLVMEGGWTVFRQMPLLFVVALPIGMAKKQNARCAMEALILFLTFHYFLSAILSQWGSYFGVNFSLDAGGTSGLAMVANIKTLDMGIMGALLISGIVIFIHNKFYDTNLPDWIGVFRGSTFVYAIGFIVMIPMAFLMALIWPKVQSGMSIFQIFAAQTGALGVWIFIFLERILIPFGLHHLLYFSFYYDNAIVHGGIYATWAENLPMLAASTEPLKVLAPYARFTLTGLSKMFGCLGIAMAFYSTAKPGKKKITLGLLIPITLTAILCGITEPIEFTFLFIAPMLFVIHALLAATLATIEYLFGLVGIFSGGAIEMAAFNWIPLMRNHWHLYIVQFIIGFIFTGIYFVIFRTIILKFNLKTPGREDTPEEVKFYSKKDYKEKQGGTSANETNDTSSAPSLTGENDNSMSFEAKILAGLGGKDNIVEVTNCATRLRVGIKDPSLVKDDAYFKSIGAFGCMKAHDSVQVIIGLKVAKVRDDFEKLL